MSLGNFRYPMPVNEPVLTYAPGNAERVALKNTLKELKGQQIDVPMTIGGKEVRSGNLTVLHPPHEIAHTLGQFHQGDASHVSQAIEAALKARESWANMSWENRANIFLRAADL